jgi:4-diphosphocytidyl-2-C-methyl-D-erythritol kinase
MRERAPAKINLCLFLGPTRPADGRHVLVSVMQSLTLADVLHMEEAPAAGVAPAPGVTPAPGVAPADGVAPHTALADHVVCPGVVGPNLAGAALAAFRAATGWNAPPQHVEIDKQVPVMAGMGGGSADAAAALRLAARASGLGDEPLLQRLGASLGADVPAQVRPGRALATGAGEQVRHLPDGAPFGVLVLPGAQPLSTAAVYAEADRLGLPRDHDDLEQALADVDEALATGGDLPLELLVNDLETAALSLQPGIEESLAQARAAGADHVMVSGSGPTVLGLFFGPHGVRRARAAATFVLAGRNPAPLVAGPEPAWSPLR